MPVPKRKRSRARIRKAFANKGIKVKAFTHCSECQAAVAPHVACRSCGHYKGIKVMAGSADKADKRSARKSKSGAAQAD